MPDKGKFLTELKLTPQPDGCTWRVDEPFVYEGVELLNDVTVPAGFVTDLASIPKLFWNILPPFGKYTGAAVLHDWVYRHHYLPRAQCDRLLLEAMEACNVPRWQCLIIYRAVRWFGWSAWNNETRRTGYIQK